LDEKIPLLRSQKAIDEEGKKLLKALGLLDKGSDDGVVANVGWEQEFFIIDRKHYLNRPDLIQTGRTLLGAIPHRGQQTAYNYFGRIPSTVSRYLSDVREQMWSVGITLNTAHNEVAPAQHEISPIFSLTNVAADQNTWCMEHMKEIAKNHGLSVLFHEKPFKDLNGNGKHNNWGVNLKPPSE